VPAAATTEDPPNPSAAIPAEPNATVADATTAAVDPTAMIAAPNVEATARPAPAMRDPHPVTFCSDLSNVSFSVESSPYNST
jgi:hypothetical protein